MTTTSARKLRIPVIATASAVALALALAGCGGGRDDDAAGASGTASGSPSGSPSGTATATASGTASPGASDPSATRAGPSGSAAPAVNASPLPATAGTKVSGTALSGRISAAIATARSASFGIVVTGSQPSSATGVTAGTGTALELRMKAEISSASTVQIIKKDGLVYLKTPSPVSDGKAWLKITNSKNDPFRSFYTTLFQSLETSADVGQTAALIGRMGTFTTGKAQVVDGAATTVYTATPPARVGVKLMPSSFQQMEESTLTASTTVVSVWVDAAGLVRRVSTTLTLPAGQTGQTAKSLVSYQNWGQPITVTVPPASQVASPSVPAS